MDILSKAQENLLDEIEFIKKFPSKYVAFSNEIKNLYLKGTDENTAFAYCLCLYHDFKQLNYTNHLSYKDDLEIKHVFHHLLHNNPDFWFIRVLYLSFLSDLSESKESDTLIKQEYEEVILYQNTHDLTQDKNCLYPYLIYGRYLYLKGDLSTATLILNSAENKIGFGQTESNYINSNICMLLNDLSNIASYKNDFETISKINLWKAKMH